MSVLADPAKAIGHTIRATGIYDIAVSEVLARLIDRGDTAIDAGANVGYMTLLAAVAAGPRGRVLSFEPHPELFGVLQRNVAAARERHQIARTELHHAALGELPGIADLILPPEYGANDGTSRISSTPAPAGACSVPVKVETLDNVLEGASAAVLKMDVEGFEIHVLRGALRALESRRIRHVVFEDHDVARSEVVRLLQDVGYTVHALGWTVKGLALSDVDAGALATAYEAPNFVASIEPDTVLQRCRRPGWMVLRPL